MKKKQEQVILNEIQEFSYVTGIKDVLRKSLSIDVKKNNGYVTVDLLLDDDIISSKSFTIEGEARFG